MNESTVSQKTRKILVMGLDNSGKTSILIALNNNSNLLSYCSSKPTKGVNIEEFKTETSVTSVWDFGGQEQYREEYLKNFKKYIEKVEKIIFVIDVQDLDRYQIAIHYLKLIINKLKTDEKTIDFSIFLHKYDPNLLMQDKFKDIDAKVNSELVRKIYDLIPSNFNIDIFKTTIYTVFEKTSI